MEQMTVGQNEGRNESRPRGKDDGLSRKYGDMSRSPRKKQHRGWHGIRSPKRTDAQETSADTGMQKWNKELEEARGHSARSSGILSDWSS
jgi:hypothetical protein